MKSRAENYKGREVIVEGIKYTALYKACDAYDLKWQNVQHRLNAGWTIEQAFELKLPPKRKESITNKRVKIRNKIYNSMADAARAYNLPEYTVRNRIGQGWTPEQAAGLEKPPNSRKKEGGHIYIIRNTKTKKVYIGLTAVGIKKRFKGHIKDAKKGSKTKFAKAIRRIGAKNFSIEKICYCKTDKSLAEKEKYWIKKYNSIETGYNTHDGGAIGTFKGKIYYYNGVKYSSRKELAAAFGISEGCVAARLKNGTPLEHPLKQIIKPVTIKNKKFASISDAIKFYGKNKGAVEHKLYVKKMSLEQALLS